eukprot:scaffold392391_cov35-Attheya_sp.AAC.1
MSRQSIPSQLELQHMTLSDSESISGSSGRDYAQELFRNAVRMRDEQKCVLTSTQFRPKTRNVEDVHIIGVERSLTQARQCAGVWNAYDTQNGMLLESSLHSDFYSFFGVWTNSSTYMCQRQEREKNYASRRILRARYALFLERSRARESKLDTKKPRRRHLTAFTI